jgi:hypothetical protein
LWYQADVVVRRRDMKGIGKYLLFVVGALFGGVISIQNVSAATLNFDWTGYYYERFDQNGNNYASWKLENYYVDGEVAYCIEPGIPEGEDYYQGSWSDAGLSDEIARKVSLIAYYGYTYPNHQTLKYRAATQGMIWATILGNNTTVRFSTERYYEGTPLDVSAETNEINRLMEEHYKVPSFDGQTINAQVGKTITLTDTNNVLSNFNVSVSGAEYSVNGNTLTIKPTTDGTININLTKKMYYERDYKIFYKDGIQNMLVAGSVDPVRSIVRVKSYYTNIKLNKTDSETTTAQGQATLNGAVYGVYKNDGTLITKITTGENGTGTSASVLRYDEDYYVQEISSSKGYYVDNTRYPINVKDNNATLDVKEKVIKNYISILKQYDTVDGTTQFLNAEANISFEIFYPDGTKFGEITTDENGYATMNIPYGVWKFHQVNSTTGFEKIYDFFITVDNNSNKEQYYNILNNALSAYLQLVKKDSETGKTIKLADTTFKILNTDTNKFVSQYLGGKVISEFKTDENGIMITPLKLSSGNYRIVEITSPKGYLLDESGVPFTIGTDTHFNYTTYGAFVVVEYLNTTIKGQIEINKEGEVFKVENGTFSYENKPLSGIEFQIIANEDIKSPDGNYIYYNKNDIVQTLTTDENGYAISEKLPLGKYKLVEIKTKDNYILNTEEYSFELTEKDNKTPIVYKSYSALNKYKKGTLEFSKTDLVNGEEIPNTKIEIYTENDELIYSGITNEQGKIIVKDIPVNQKMYIIESEAATGYVITNEKVFFIVKENGEVVKAEMKNKPITSTLEFTKTDISTSEPLPNTLIEIYKKDTNELVFSGRTDENGKIVIEDLEYGDYVLYEKEAPESYQINEEPMYFSIKEQGEIVKCTMTDERIVEVPNTESNDYYVIEIIGGILLVIGSGVIIYANKKSKEK